MKDADNIDRSPAAGSPWGLHRRDIQIGLFGWGLYMVLLSTYCVLHQKFVQAVTPDVEGTVIWSVREWTVWMFLTPVAFVVLRRYWPIPHKRIPVFLKMGAGVLVVSLTFRIGLDYITGYRDMVASFVVFFPRHLAAPAAVLVIWYLFLRNTSPAEQPPQYPRTLFVNKGGDECLIRVNEIQYISAAKNYVEIVCDDRPYLMRATMQQIETLLPPSVFARTHRSHIVNVNEIERIKVRRSGNGEVLLRCGITLPVSKKYKPRLQQFRQ